MDLDYHIGKKNENVTDYAKYFIILILTDNP